MVTNERASIENVLRLAQQIAAQLEPMAASANSTEGLCLRLAQAHALGLLDQLNEIVGAHEQSDVATAAMRHSAVRVARPLEEETLQAV